MDETKRVTCKNCGKEFEAPIVFYTRKDGRKVGKVRQYCEKACYSKWFKKVTE